MTLNSIRIPSHGEEKSTLASMDRFLVSSVADISQHLHFPTAARAVHLSLVYIALSCNLLVTLLTVVFFYSSRRSVVRPNYECDSVY